MTEKEMFDAFNAWYSKRWLDDSGRLFTRRELREAFYAAPQVRPQSGDPRRPQHHAVESTTADREPAAAAPSNTPESFEAVRERVREVIKDALSKARLAHGVTVGGGEVKYWAEERLELRASEVADVYALLFMQSEIGQITRPAGESAESAVTDSGMESRAGAPRGGIGTSATDAAVAPAAAPSDDKKGDATPRTDALLTSLVRQNYGVQVEQLAGLAQQLERELSAVQSAELEFSFDCAQCGRRIERFAQSAIGERKDG